MKKVMRRTTVLVFVMALLLGITASASAETIVFGDFSWDSVQVHNRIAGFIIEHGYGYDVDFQFGESIPILLGIRRGDVDVTMEGWVDNWLDAMYEAHVAGEVISLGSNFPDAPQGWYVPTYMIEGDPERGIEASAPELRSVQDLAQYADLFPDPEDPNKGRFYNAPTGWGAHDINNAKVEAYGLDEYFNSFDTGSDAALGAAMMRYYERGEPFVAYNWEPNWVIGLLDMTLLEEPEYNEQQWREDYSTAYPATRVEVIINAELAGRAPLLTSFLANYNTTIEQTNEALAYMQLENASAQETALWFLENYRDVWTEWVFAPEVAERVTDALALQ